MCARASSEATISTSAGYRSPSRAPGCGRAPCSQVPKEATMAEQWVDIAIVGGGSAGSALANRLSADRGTQVLLLEAGRRDWRFDIFIHMPAALTIPIGNGLYDWRYESEPEEHLGGRRIYHARGKVLGGSS